jgi:hypothetical protein
MFAPHKPGTVAYAVESGADPVMSLTLSMVLGRKFSFIA